MAIETPEWVKHAVFYHIFPDRFARGKPPRGGARPWTDSVSFEPWMDPPTLGGYKGGDLWGIAEGLAYLQDLGIDAIYLTPIFRAACNHRYHTHDYYQIDPLLGGNEAFQALRDAAHQRGIKIVLDGVFNHASRGFFYFHDILENGPHSPWLDWFKIRDWPVSAYDGSKPANYDSWSGNRALPEFNHDCAAAREYLMQVGEYWIAQGIDGWRLDVPFEIEAPGFWQEFRRRVKAINPEAYLVGEIWGDASAWLDGTQFDGVMNYRFCGPTIAFAAGERVRPEYVEQPDYAPYPPLDAAGYASEIATLLELYPREIGQAQLNLLDSHDTARLLTIAGGDRASIHLATLLLMTFPGAPSIYYGDEVGLPGGLDPDSRRGFPPHAQWDGETRQIHQELIALRRAHPALHTGDYRILLAEGGVYAFARVLGTAELIVAVNAGTEAVSVAIEAPSLQSQPERLRYGRAQLSWDGSTLQLDLPARSGCVLSNE
ncbi:MAG: alpha-amylase [Cyanobacteria bacterium QS_8_64_29]|nr:MAG: alpha-amylase [Cyanobacteria bacterium QS_8_64_29]